MHNTEITYDDLIEDDVHIKERFLNQCIDPEHVFVTIHNNHIFHVLKAFPHPIRCVCFREDEFTRFIKDGTVIAFKETHKGCEATYEGEELILKFMEANLPFEKYSRFEGWMFNQT
jgi:hypothetical protein